MRTTRYKFDEIGGSWTKTGTCPACGKKASRSKKFWQTQTPFNVGANGEPKSIAQIRSENAQKANEWQALPVFHAGCES